MKGMSGLLLAALLLVGCTAAQHRAAVRDDTIRGISVGTVQREIHVGMSGADVIAAIGPPNIVSTDGERNEVWVYDKLATDVVYSSSDGGVLALIFGSAAGAAGTGRLSSGASSTSQRTLTVVIHFDAAKRVSDFAYHASQF